MPHHTFILNGEKVTVDVEDDVRLLWVLRDMLGVHRPEVRLRHQRLQGLHQPRQRQGLQPLLGAGRGDQRQTDEITTIEGLPGTVGEDLHPMQEAWIEHDVAQCGYCQPGQIMAAVAVVKQGQGRGPGGHRRRPRRDPQHLPVRHLHPDPGGREGRRRADVAHDSSDDARDRRGVTPSREGQHHGGGQRQRGDRDGDQGGPAGGAHVAPGADRVLVVAEPPVARDADERAGQHQGEAEGVADGVVGSG